MRMEANSTIIGVGVTAVVAIVSYLIYRNMGCNVSSPVKNSATADASALADSSTKKKADKEKYPAGKLSIYFGSQTGTAEGFARTLMEEGGDAGFQVKVIDLEDFDAEVLRDSTEKVIFLMATYGEGEPTDNAVSFYKWLKDSDGELDSSSASKVNFCVFGLGNTQYEHYNRMGKFVNERMEAIGGKRMYKYGEGDDDGTLEEDFDAWKADLWTELRAAFHPDAAGGAATTDINVGSHKVKLQFAAVPTTAKSLSTREPAMVGETRSARVSSKSGKIAPSTKHFFTCPRAKVLVNRELRNGDEKKVGSTRHMEIDLQSVNIDYQTADNLAILPENDPHKVAALAQALGYNLSDTFNIEPVEDNEDNFQLAFPTPCTIQEALTLYTDIQGPVKHSMLKHLQAYTTDKTQSDWLENLLSKDNRAELKVLVEESGLSFVDLLTNQLSSCKIPLSDLLHIVPFIQPRYYTISSSSNCFPDVVHITISLTEFDLKSGKSFVGLTSGHVKNICYKGSAAASDIGMGDGMTCRVFVRASSFRLPKDLATPIIMIGPGTGLAPMRALLQERKFQQQEAGGPSAKMGSNVLFFGCKHANVDYIYRNELETYAAEGVLSELHTAFSRDGPKKVYVQHLIKEDATANNLVKLIVEEGAYVYVCGATAMGHDVLEAITSIIQSNGGKSATEASTMVKNLQDSGRYVQELWTA